MILCGAEQTTWLTDLITTDSWLHLLSSPPLPSQPLPVASPIEFTSPLPLTQGHSLKVDRLIGTFPQTNRFGIDFHP